MGLIEFFRDAKPGTDRTMRMGTCSDGSAIVWLTITSGQSKVEVSGTGLMPATAIEKAFQELEILR